jgi:hypothetical protein
LLDGVFLASIIENEGGAVRTFGRSHLRSLRLSEFIARDTPLSSRRVKPDR